MSNRIEIITSKESPGCECVRNFLSEIDDDFKPSLSSKVSLETYAGKLNSNATFILAMLGEELIGMTAFYANDLLKKRGLFANYWYY
ncbi:hypothetical protein SAMN04488033_101318 [Salegentibacter agarivorans]|uniref:Acetyltransferase (GNAT) domain-containing protein n=1 Tax=Salegentibacter agarivorans TaxID=345907 RepID=A0A1I2K1E5_9FLAO|nr:hypothetical protein [Salegentibacter agarivorans]SFF60163.1 hypothetical protein SAMN04488033_101318 [Salegentibacter agarivorans]